MRAGWVVFGQSPAVSLGLEDLDSFGVSYFWGWIKFDQGWGMKPGQGVSDSTAALKDGMILFAEQPSFQADLLASLPC